MGRLVGAVGTVLLAFVLPAIGQDVGPDQLVHRITQEGIDRYVDFEEATRLAAGNAWVAASPEQKKRLVEEFRKLLVRLYGNAIALYPGRNLKLIAAKVRSENVVHAHLTGRSGHAVPVNFLVRRVDRAWLVYDISFEGVSLVRAYRADFEAAVKQGGIEGLIKRLSEKNARI